MKKNILEWLPVGVFILTVMSCTDARTKTNPITNDSLVNHITKSTVQSVQDSGKLVMRGKATFWSGIGYASIFEFRISAVITGVENDTSVRLLIGAGNRQLESFLSEYEKAKKDIELTCVKSPGRSMSKSGFEDENKVWWEIERVKDPEKHDTGLILVYLHM